MIRRPPRSTRVSSSAASDVYKRQANNKTKRRFLPNLKKVKFTSELLKRSLKLTVSNAGVRSVDKKGSFDEFLKSVKNKNLSPRLKKLKKSLLIKSPFQKKTAQSKTA